MLRRSLFTYRADSSIASIQSFPFQPSSKSVVGDTDENFDYFSVARSAGPFVQRTHWPDLVGGLFEAFISLGISTKVLSLKMTKIWARISLQAPSSGNDGIQSIRLIAAFANYAVLHFCFNTFRSHLSGSEFLVNCILSSSWLIF